MGRVYSAVFEGIAVTAIQDLFSILTPATCAVQVIALFISQSNREKDVADEQLSFRIRRGQTTAGSGGAAVTPVPLDAGDPASTCTVRRNDTTQASAGTIVVLHRESLNIRAGLAYIPVPEARIILRPSTRMTFELVEAPAASTTMDSTVIFEEIS